MPCDIGHYDAVFVAQGVILPEILHDIGILAQHIEIILKGLFFRYEGDRADIWHRRETVGQRLGLFPRKSFIDENGDLVLRRQAVDEHINIIRHKGKSRNNEQTGRDDGHRGKAHKAMKPYARYTFLKKVGDIGL